MDRHRSRHAAVSRRVGAPARARHRAPAGRGRRHAARGRAPARVHARPQPRRGRQRARTGRRRGRRDRARRRRHLSRARTARRVPDRDARRRRARPPQVSAQPRGGRDPHVCARRPRRRSRAWQDGRMVRDRAAPQAVLDGHRVPQVGHVPRPRAQRHDRPQLLPPDQSVRLRVARDVVTCRATRGPRRARGHAGRARRRARSRARANVALRDREPGRSGS